MGLRTIFVMQMQMPRPAGRSWCWHGPGPLGSLHRFWRPADRRGSPPSVMTGCRCGSAASRYRFSPRAHPSDCGPLRLAKNCRPRVAVLPDDYRCVLGCATPHHCGTAQCRDWMLRCAAGLAAVRSRWPGCGYCWLQYVAMPADPADPADPAAVVDPVGPAALVQPAAYEWSAAKQRVIGCCRLQLNDGRGRDRPCGARHRCATACRHAGAGSAGQRALCVPMTGQQRVHADARPRLDPSALGRLPHGRDPRLQLLVAEQFAGQFFNFTLSDFRTTFDLILVHDDLLNVVTRDCACGRWIPSCTRSDWRRWVELLKNCSSTVKAVAQL